MRYGWRVSCAPARAWRCPGGVAALLCAALTALAANLPAHAGETQVERALAAELPASSIVWLQAGGQRFLALRALPAQRKPVGGVVIVPGSDQNPDWPDVVRPLRLGLAGAGWFTLSLQVPARADYAGSGTARARILAGLAWLHAHGVAHPVLLAYGGGAAAALSAVGAAAPAALVLVSPVSRSAAVPVSSFARLRVPLLLVTGTRDRQATYRLARRAARAHAAGHPARYRHMSIGGAGHAYHDMGEVLASRVEGWLVRRVLGRPPGGRVPGS